MTIPKPSPLGRKYRVHSSRVSTEHCLEEYGPDESLCVEFIAFWDITPGEPMVMYDRDGGGYPGSPPEAELLEVHVTEAEGEYAKIDRTTSKGIEFLDSLEADIRQLVEDDKDGSYHEEAFQALSDAIEGAKEAAAEDKYQAMRDGD